MPRKLHINTEQKETLYFLLNNNHDLKTFKRIQSVLIPIECKTTLVETSKLLGISRTKIVKIRKETHDILQGKELVFKQNGGRRNQNMTLEEEVLLLESFKASTAMGEHIDSYLIKKAYEEKLDRVVPLSSLETYFLLLEAIEFKKEL